MKRLVSVVWVILTLGGCLPLVLESDSAIDAKGYVFPLAGGTYVADGLEIAEKLVITNHSNHVELAILKKDTTDVILIGGFLPLLSSGYYVLQVTDAIDDGKPANKKPGESVFIPVSVSSPGKASWFTAPIRCNEECKALFTSFGFTGEASQSWHAPKNLPHERILSFYEALASLHARDPQAWQGGRILAIPSTPQGTGGFGR